MSIIHQLKEHNQRLREENLRLRSEKKAVEKDIVAFAFAVKDAWDYIGIDFSKIKNVGHIVSTLTRRLMGGKIKASVLEEKYMKVSPILAKYDHLMKAEETRKIEENV